MANLQKSLRETTAVTVDRPRAKREDPEVRGESMIVMRGKDARCLPEVRQHHVPAAGWSRRPHPVS